MTLATAHRRGASAWLAIGLSLVVQTRVVAQTRPPVLDMHMHAGYPLREDLQALLFTHPQVSVELSMAVNVEARPAFSRFLRELVVAGCGHRIMFGSDQMVWPGLIDAGVRSIEAAPLLTARQKRDILYNNAARFLRLSAAEIARHHGR